jgi:diguanylate cyclase (GGDEF)-like protein
MIGRLSLRTLLTLPYVALVLTAAGIIGVLSYGAGRDAVDNLSGQLLVETVNRIAQTVDRHVAGSAAVLEAAFPKGVGAPASIEAELPALRTRFWLATSVHLDPNNYAYYGDREGRFFGLWRHSESEAELRLRLQGQGARQIHRFTGIAGELQPASIETRVFEPRERPWFKAAMASPAPTWTSIYIDFKTAELVATRARRVQDDAGQFAGVVATDLSLQRVNNFLRQLAISKNGLAMVTETDGQLIGVSRGPHLRQMAGGGNARLNAAESTDAMVVATNRAVRELMGTADTSAPRTGTFTGHDGQRVQVGYARLHDDAGLDWLIMVAVPRQDFLHQVEQNFVRTGVLAALAALAVVAIGLVVLSTVTLQLRLLAEAARQVGQGRLGTPLTSTRKDELGELTRSFGEMQRRLFTDLLTGLSNRDAVLRDMNERVLQHRRRGETQVQVRPFAVLFCDLNDFKQINDQYGHDVGDDVLRELAQRLRDGVRAGDRVARWAGDEFVILLDSAPVRQDAEVVRDHLEAALQQPMKALAALAPHARPSGAAFGLAVYPDDGQDVETLLKRADEDMYRRKGGSAQA